MITTKPLIEPQQKRAKQTYEKLLSATQEILAESGLEALNSNAIVNKAGITAPSFYRYFENKHCVLAVLAHRLMDAQNDIVLKTISERKIEKENIYQTLRDIVDHTYGVSKAMVGASPLLIALRAIPQLSHIRLESHAQTSKLTADEMMRIFPDLDPQIALHRARLVIEYGYAAVELLLEVPELETEIILEANTQAQYNILVTGIE